MFTGTARSVCHCVAGLAATFEPKLTTVCVCALHQFAVTLCAWLRALLTYLNWCLVHGSCAVRGAWMWGVVLSNRTLLGLNIGPVVEASGVRSNQPKPLYETKGAPKKVPFIIWSTLVFFYLKTTQSAKIRMIYHRSVVYSTNLKDSNNC